MKNMMKEYLGRDYSNNHLRNFCLYWMKGRESMPKWGNSKDGRNRYNEWRCKNDLDCLYLDGDLKADTLMSAWTPIKWVVDYLNSEREMKFYKKATMQEDQDYYLKLLANDRDAYLPPEHELVLLLDRFLELAEERWNYILLPDEQMNTERYRITFDEVPAMLYHIFQRDSLGKYFLDETGMVDRMQVDAWIQREHLYMGFESNDIHFNPEDIIPLTETLVPSEAKWLTEEREIKHALQYMIDFLEKRKKDFEK